MGKKSKIFFSIFFSAVLIITAMSFFKFYVLKDYYIKSEAACDPRIEKCFIYECDPAVDNECSEDPAERVSYYKLIKKMAKDLPTCDPSQADCPALACLAGEDCREIFCDEETISEGEACNDPIEYLKNSSITEAEGQENVSSGNNLEYNNGQSQPPENSGGN